MNLFKSVTIGFIVLSSSFANPITDNQDAHLTRLHQTPQQAAKVGDNTSLQRRAKSAFKPSTVSSEENERESFDSSPLRGRIKQLPAANLKNNIGTGKRAFQFPEHDNVQKFKPSGLNKLVKFIERSKSDKTVWQASFSTKDITTHQTMYGSYYLVQQEQIAGVDISTSSGTWNPGDCYCATVKEFESTNKRVDQGIPNHSKFRDEEHYSVWAKIGSVSAIQVTKDHEGEVVTTKIGGRIETQQHVKEGDWVVRNDHSNYKEEQVLKNSDFHERYEQEKR